jgi:hypothetical protein
MKEIIKTAVAFVLVVLAAIVVTTTRGSDTMDWKLDFNIKTEESFAYPIDTTDSLNGEYKRLTGDYRYIMVGKNPDSKTYRVYFIQVGSAVLGSTTKNVVLRLDNLQLDGNNTAKFKTSNEVPMKITFRPQSAIVEADMSLGDASIEGHYQWQKNIGSFSLDEFQIFK